MQVPRLHVCLHCLANDIKIVSVSHHLAMERGTHKKARICYPANLPRELTLGDVGTKSPILEHSVD